MSAATQGQTGPDGINGVVGRAARQGAKCLEAVFALVMCYIVLAPAKFVRLFSSFASTVFQRAGLAGKPAALTCFGVITAFLTSMSARTPETALLQEFLFLFSIALILVFGPRGFEAAASVKATPTGWPLEKLFARAMAHPQDAAWANVVAFASVLLIPAFAGIAIPSMFGTHTAILYCAVIYVTWKSLTDFEHADAHYQFFHRLRVSGAASSVAARALDIYLTYVLTITLARVPHWYEVQHVVIHHAEDNGRDDTQSTLPYDRASFVDFCICANRFALSGLVSIDVARYLIRKRRWKALRRLYLGMLCFYAVVGALVFVNWPCALLILATRYVTGIVSSMGFFQEHGLVDTDEPDSIFRNSLHYLAPDNEHGSRGEDFHIEHHLHPGRHWTAYTPAVAQNLGRYAEEGSVGFLDGDGHIRTYYKMLWRRDFAGLAPYFVGFAADPVDTFTMANLLEARTRPVGASKRLPLVEGVDRALGRFAGALL